VLHLTLLLYILSYVDLTYGWWWRILGHVFLTLVVIDFTLAVSAQGKKLWITWRLHRDTVRRLREKRRPQ
jgi:hypothetical protein